MVVIGFVIYGGRVSLGKPVIGLVGRGAEHHR